MNRPSQKVFRAASVGLGLIVLSVSLGVALGWILGGDSSKVALGSRMKFNTAVSLAAASLGLWFANLARNSKSFERLGHIFSLLPFSIGLVTTLEYVFHFNSGLSQLIVSDPMASVGFPGQMAPNTAICLLSLGGALLFIDGIAWLNRLAQWLAITSACISLFAIFGYIFEVQGLYQVSTLIKMSAYSAISIFLLSIATLIARPQFGIVRTLIGNTPSGIFARGMMIAAFTIPPLLCWLGMIAEENQYLSGKTAWALTSLLSIILFTSFVWQSTDSIALSEQAVRDSELQFKMKMNSIPQLAWTADQNGDIDWYNQRWFDYTGRSLEDMLGWGWKDVHAAEALPMIVEKWKTAIAEKRIWEDIVQLRGRDGQFRWFLSRAVPIRNEAGEVTRWLGSNTDIEEQRRVEKALRESEQKYSTLASSIPQLVWTCLANGRCNYLSKQWVEYTGFAGSALLGYSWLSMVIHPDDRERTLDHWMKAVQELNPYDIEYRIRRHDGEYRWFKARGAAVRDELGRTSFWVGTCTDVHDQRIVLDELNQAKLVAEAASFAKTQFLANMSHEIRTPIGAITGFADLMKSSLSSDADKLNYAAIIERNSKHLLRLVDDILDLSKVEAGKITFESAIFDFHEFLRDFDAAMSLKASEKGIRFQLSVEEVPKQILSDQLRIRQILSNIVGNAIKFTEKGSVNVEIHFEDKLLRISVRDTGIGISPENAQNLFQAFHQADPTFTRKFGGTGLGLSLSKRLANRLNGDVLLKESIPGSGSHFEATILIDVPDKSSLERYLRTDRVASVDSPQIRAEKHPLNGLKILLIEDSPDNQILITSYLRKTGASLLTEGNGLAGYRTAIREHPDLVIMDIQMPEMDGHEATRKLRASGFLNPIIALTAHAMRDERDKCYESGCSDYLTKPIDREVLIQALSNHS